MLFLSKKLKKCVKERKELEKCHCEYKTLNQCRFKKPERDFNRTKNINSILNLYIVFSKELVCHRE